MAGGVRFADDVEGGGLPRPGAEKRYEIENDPLAELSHRMLDSANGLFVFVVHVL